MRVVIVDDQELIRRGLALLLSTMGRSRSSVRRATVSKRCPSWLSSSPTWC